MATWRAPRGLCKKCGGGYATHFYHEAGDCIGRRNRRDDEHLHYICKCCGYDWCVDVYVPVEDDGKVPGWLFFVPITIFATIVFVIVALIE